MDRLIHTAFSGLQSAGHRQRAIANNLANASTTGFRAEQFAVTPITVRGTGLEVRASGQGAVRSADLGSGTFVQTGEPLDIALEGNALLTLQARDGGEVYSRRGDLKIAASGLLQNGDGLPVIGIGGPITIPAAGDIRIAENGAVLLSDPAAPEAPAVEVARLKLANPQGSPVVKDIDGFLRVPNGGVLPDDPTARLASGTLEGSNVNSAQTLVAMIEAQRSFEQNAKIISTADQLDQSSARLMSLR